MRQNDLLAARNVALTVTLCGVAVDAAAGIVYVSSKNVPATTACLVAGGVATLSGGVWLIANAICLNKLSRQINDHMTVELAPGGLALRF